VILVFGGNGQLGRELVVRARAEAIPLAAIGRSEADIADPVAVAAAFDRYRPKLVVNAAGYNRVDQAESEPEAAERTNAIGPAVLASAANSRGLPLIHVSTDYVFDGRKSGPYREDDAVAPLSAYGRSKERGEQAVRAAAHQHLILRTAWLFGAHGANFLKTVLRLAEERDRLEFVADQRGSPTAAADLAQAILIVCRAVERGPVAWGTYHVAGSTETSRYGLACAIVEAQARFTGRRPKVDRVSSAEFGARARRPAQSVLDSSKFAAAFGFRPGGWEVAVERTVAELLSGKVPV